MKNTAFCILLVSSLLLAGCFTTRPVPILLGDEKAYVIPAGVPFKAKESKDGEVKEFVRDEVSYVLSPTKWIKLEECCNSGTTDALK